MSKEEEILSPACRGCMVMADCNNNMNNKSLIHNFIMMTM